MWSAYSPTLDCWAEDPPVPEYVNRLEDAQKKSVRAKLLIDDKWLAAIATGSLLAAVSFPKQRPNWDSPPPRQQDVGSAEDHFPLTTAHARA